MTKLQVGVNDLATTHPHLANQWVTEKNNGIKPSEIIGGKRMAWWQCKKGHMWETSIDGRKSGNGCPVCAGKQVAKGFNDLLTLAPDVAAQWHPFKNKGLKDKNGRDISTPDKVTISSGQKIWWYFPYDVPMNYPIKSLRGEHFDFEWENSVKEQRKLSGCPYLSKSNTRIWIGFNDLRTTHPELAAQWHPTKNIGLKDGKGKDISTPDKVTAASNQKVWWYLHYKDETTGESHSFEWQAIIANRIKYPECPYIEGKYVKIGFNDMATTHPELAREWHPTKNGSLKPTEIMAGSDKKVWWYLPYDDPVTSKHFEFEWEAKVSNRSHGKGCPFLSGKAVWKGFNDLASKRPDLCLEWDYTKNKNLLPQEISYGSGKRIWWKCSKGHEWKASVSDRVRGRDCPICAESKGEKIIRKVLEDNHVVFEEQHKFKDRFYKSIKNLLRDDFAIIDNQGNVIATIEFHGQQHYEPVDFAGKGCKWAEETLKETKIRDKIKADYLKARNISQLIIPYWEFDDIEQIVNNYIRELSLKYILFKNECV